jgi:hypothetical protein
MLSFVFQDVTSRTHYPASLLFHNRTIHTIDRDWVFRALTLACSHATFLVLPYESACNPKGSMSTKRQ